MPSSSNIDPNRHHNRKPIAILKLSFNHNYHIGNLCDLSLVPPSNHKCNDEELNSYPITNQHSYIERQVLSNVVTFAKEYPQTRFLSTYVTLYVSPPHSPKLSHLNVKSSCETYRSVVERQWLWFKLTFRFHHFWNCADYFNVRVSRQFCFQSLLFDC